MWHYRIHINLFTPLLFLSDTTTIVQLRFPHEDDVRFLFTSSCLYDGSCLNLRYLCLLTHSGVSHIIYFSVCCWFCWFFFIDLCMVVSNMCCVVILFCFSSSCVPYHMLPVPLDCPFLISPSEFINMR